MNFTPYSTVTPLTRGDAPNWYPQEERERVAAYVKYDQLYWNDNSQFALRVLEGEYPIYVPNARTIVDTTSHFLLKGLQVTAADPTTQAALKQLLDREMFYSRFHLAKHAGVARGDFCFHLTANPKKVAGRRLSLNSVEPENVIIVRDPDDITHVVRVHLVDLWVDKDLQGQPKQYIKKLTYEYDGEGANRRVMRSEGIYELEDGWFGQRPKLYKTTIAPGLLPEGITTIPVYWFKNMTWEGQPYGSSELRGFEEILRGVSQAATDQEASLSLEGLGVYATDGGRPVDDEGHEVDWVVSPGKVMEVPTGSYFRRVEGLNTLKPSMDHINYLESKLREAGGLSDVALGRVDVQTAQSGIALAIKFMPTLAKLDERDLAGIDGLTQLFHDWKDWHQVYEGVALSGDIAVEIGAKLPQDDTATLNELNNMLDRGVISKKYYRERMKTLGWEFPDDIEQQIEDEKKAEAELAAQTAPPGLVDNAVGAVNGSVPPPPGRGGNGTLPPAGNRSNNRNRPNESSGTEATQTARRQARGGTPPR